MELDLTAILGNLALDGSGRAAESPTESPTAPIEGAGHGGLQDGRITPLNRPREADDGILIPDLARRRQAEMDDVQRARDAYSKYQDNIKAAGRMRTEILAGVRAGEPIEPLFLKACKVISLMTAEPLFAGQIEQDLISIYGKGQGAAAPLQMAAEQIQQRLDRMRQALGRETDPEDRRRIQAAITAHQNRLQALQEQGRCQG